MAARLRHPAGNLWMKHRCHSCVFFECENDLIPNTWNNEEIRRRILCFICISLSYRTELNTCRLNAMFSIIIIQVMESTGLNFPMLAYLWCLKEPHWPVNPDLCRVYQTPEVKKAQWRWRIMDSLICATEGD